VSALAGTLPGTRTLPRRGTRNLEAYDLFARGRWLVFETTKAARPLLRKATELDPGYRPDMLRPQRRLLTNQLPLVPGLALLRHGIGVLMVFPWSSSSVRKDDQHKAPGGERQALGQRVARGCVQPRDVLGGRPCFSRPRSQ